METANTLFMQRGTRGDKRIHMKGYKRRQGKKTRGDNGRQDTGEGRHTIHMKGYKYKGRQGETGGDKTLDKADTLSNTKADTLRKH